MGNWLNDLAGANAFSITAAAFTQPAVSASVTVQVDSSAWVTLGVLAFCAIGGAYSIVAKTPSTITLVNLGGTNAAAGTVIASGSVVSPGGATPVVGSGLVVTGSPASGKVVGYSGSAIWQILPHSALSGLVSGDDHTQYVRVDGTRAFAGDQSLGGHKVTSLATPTAGTDAATKAYVDAFVSGVSPRPAVKAMADANVASLSGTTTVDTIALSVGDRALLTAQTTQTQNGPWVIASGAWTRPTDFATGSSAGSAFFFIEQGATHSDQGWLCTANPPNAVVGTNNLPFVQFSAAGVIIAGNGLTKTGNSLAVTAADSSIIVTSSGISVGTLIPAVAVAATGNLTLSGEQTIDGFTTSASRVLAWQQTDGTQNGIYVSAAGAWARSTDQSAPGQFRGPCFFLVLNGSANVGRFATFVQADTNPIVVGASLLEYAVGFPPAVPTTDDNKTLIASGGNLSYGLIADSNISPTAAIQLTKLDQGGATPSQVLTWKGSFWGPGSVIPTTTVNPPADVTKAAASAGTATDLARSDHKHDISTATGVAVGATSAEGTATSLSRSDHTHAVTNLALASQAQGDIAYFNGTAWVRLAASTAGNVLTTQGASANPTWTTPAVGLALTSSAPQNVTKAAAAAGTATDAARSDHKHDITTAATTSVGTANAEGSATSLARSDHTHAVTGLSIASQAQGDVLYYNGTSWVRLGAGTSGQVLKTQGAAANPVWAAIAVTQLTAGSNGQALITTGGVAAWGNDFGSQTLVTTGSVTGLAALQFGSAQTTPTVSQADTAVSNATGALLTVRGQNATTGASSVGGSVLVAGGTGNLGNGNVALVATAANYQAMAGGLFFGKVATVPTGLPANGLFAWSTAAGEFVTVSTTQSAGSVNVTRIGDGTTELVYKGSLASGLDTAHTFTASSGATCLVVGAFTLKASAPTILLGAIGSLDVLVTLPTSAATTALNAIAVQGQVGTATTGTGVGGDARLLGGDVASATGQGGAVLIKGGTNSGSAAKSGNVAIGKSLLSSAWQGMATGIFVADRDAAPTGNPAAGGFMYSESGALKWRGSSGTTTTVAPA